MARATSCRRAADTAERPRITAPTTRARDRRLFKDDCPRAVDRYIDYFGGQSPRGVASLSGLGDSASRGAGAR